MVVSRAASVAAVPLVLHNLGSDVYAAWAVAGSLIMLQSLFDLGVAAALVRFVAVAAAKDSRRVVLVVLRRSLVVYGGLSVVVGLPLWIFSRDLAGLLPYLHGKELDEAAVIVRYVAVAFGLTNMTLVLASLLQGVNRVDASYRAQTIGWLLYVPILSAGFEFGWSVHAVGLAWVLSYAAQLALLLPPSVAAVRGLETPKSRCLVGAS